MRSRNRSGCCDCCGLSIGGVIRTRDNDGLAQMVDRGDQIVLGMSRGGGGGSWVVGGRVAGRRGGLRVGIVGGGLRDGGGVRGQRGRRGEGVGRGAAVARVVRGGRGRVGGNGHLGVRVRTM